MALGEKGLQGWPDSPPLPECKNIEPIRKLMKTHLWRLAIACLSLAGTFTASAADLVWTNTAGGNWNTAANWFPNQVPSIADDVFITNTGSYTVTITPGSYSANSVVIGGGLGSQSLTIGTINGSYSFTLNTSGVINSNGRLSLSRGTMTGNANITNAGVFNWTGGTMSGSGQTINTSGGTHSTLAVNAH